MSARLCPGRHLFLPVVTPAADPHVDAGHRDCAWTRAAQGSGAPHGSRPASIAAARQFLFGFCIGTAIVTAMATAGADYAMALLWTVLLSCAITFFLIDLYGTFTLATTSSS